MSASIAELGVVGLGAALARGELSAVDATRAYLERIARHDRRIGAFLHVAAVSALEEAAASDLRRRTGTHRSDLDGIPIALKDNIDVAGMPCTNGMGALRDRRPEEDAYVVARLRLAGCVFLGKLTMHEAALGATNDNPHFGRCENPRLPGYTPGGSSGGAGAAVAAGLCAAALGTDTLGSVRVPASYCGTVGLLPTRGLVSRSGVMALSPTLDQVGVLARSAADAARLLAQIVGYDEYDDQSVRMPADYLIEPAAELPMGLRIAVIETGDAARPSNDAAMAATAMALVHSGQGVEPRHFPEWNPTRLRRAGLLIAEAEGYVANRAWLDADGVSDSLREMLEFGARQSAERVEEARKVLREARRQWRVLLRDFDTLLLPTTPQPSFRFGEPVPADQADFTSPASIAGLPAISVPAGATADGRPLGVQIVGRAFDDTRVVALGRIIETALGPCSIA